MRILITYGSKHGGSKGIAECVAMTLAQAGHRVDVRTPERIDGLGGYDAAIIGAGLYAGRWVRAARRFVERHELELRRMPVWMFSSGPLDDSAREKVIPPTPAIARLIKRVGARGHAGDFRDMAAIGRWARVIAGELKGLTIIPTAPQPAAVRPLRRLLVGLCGFTGVTAVAVGVQLMLAPHGLTPTTMLDGTPFTSLFVPGPLLAGVVGLTNLVAGTLVFRRHRAGELAALAAGLALTTWIAVQVSLIGAEHWLQALYLAVGLATIGAAVSLARLRRGALWQRPTQPRPIRQVPTPAITS